MVGLFFGRLFYGWFLSTKVIDAFVSSLSSSFACELVLLEYSEHTLGDNERSDAIAYIQMSINGQRYCGVGQSNDIVEASLRAVLNAANRAGISKEVQPSAKAINA